MGIGLNALGDKNLKIRLGKGKGETPIFVFFRFVFPRHVNVDPIIHGLSYPWEVLFWNSHRNLGPTYIFQHRIGLGS